MTVGAGLFFGDSGTAPAGSAADVTYTADVGASLALAGGGCKAIVVSNTGTEVAICRVSLSDTTNFQLAHSAEPLPASSIAFAIAASGSYTFYLWRKVSTGTPSCTVTIAGNGSADTTISVTSSALNMTTTAINMGADNVWDFDSSGGGAELTDKAGSLDITTTGTESASTFDFVADSGPFPGMQGQLDLIGTSGGWSVKVENFNYHRDSNDRSLFCLWSSPASWTTSRAILMGPGAGAGNNTHQFVSIERTSSKVLVQPYIFNSWVQYPIDEYKTSGEPHSDANSSGMLTVVRRDGTAKSYYGESWDESAGKYGKLGTDSGEADAGTTDGPLYFGGGGTTYNSSACSHHLTFGMASAYVSDANVDALKTLIGL